jgi:hypothetical protein
LAPMVARGVAFSRLRTLADSAFIPSPVSSGSHCDEEIEFPESIQLLPVPYRQSHKTTKPAVGARLNA